MEQRIENAEVAETQRRGIRARSVDPSEKMGTTDYTD